MSFGILLPRLARSARRASERGQVLAFVALLIPTLLGCGGLAIDVGLASAGRRDAQNAADAAALAGADVLNGGGTATEARSEARKYASAGGYSPSDTTVNVPPLSGPHTGDAHFVEVIIQHSQPTVFMKILNVKTVSTGARAVGKWSNRKNYGFVVLNQTMCSALYQGGSSAVTVNGGGVMVNSSCKPAGTESGSSYLTADFIDYFKSGSWSGTSTSVPPSAVDDRLDDPYATLTRPAPGTASPDSGGTATNPALKSVSGPVTLHPGTYYGGLRVGGNGAVTLLPGTYVFAGGGLTTIGGGTVVGSGVTLFNTGDPAASQSKNRPCGAIDFGGSVTFQVTAPPSGTYRDMLLWQDDSCTETMSYHGSGDKTSGVIYLPNAKFDSSGGGTIGAVQVIVDSYEHTGGYNLTIDTGNFAPLGKVILVE